MINRNNYEEYLLLYIDGELSPVEKEAVDAFLEAHPDVKEELQLLQQTVLQPENDIAFSGKDMLYRKEAGITLSNCEEYFLLYVDEELSPAEKATVETFVLQHPEVQDTFTLLKQTVLPKEEIIFSNKEVLYKKEEKRRPVVISMLRASLAAAVMIGIIVTLWIVYSDNNTAGDATAHRGSQQPKTKTTLPGIAEPTPVVAQPDNELSFTGTSTANSDKREIKQDQTRQQEPGKEEIAVVPYNDAPKQDRTINPEPVAVNTTIVNPVASNSGNTEPEGTKVVSTGSPEIAEAPVQHAVYTEELNAEDDSKNIYVGALQINTDKVRGLFRKAGRFISGKVKNKDDDDGKIQVANFEINKLK